MVKGALGLVNRLRDIVDESGRIPKGTLVRWAVLGNSAAVSVGAEGECRYMSPPLKWAGHLA